MNALEILGLACVDATFRKLLFENVAAVIDLNRADLTWAEEDGLRRITKKYRPRKPAAARPAQPARRAAAKSAEDQNPLQDELAQVGEAIAMMCPSVPCPWPDFFTQNKPKI